MKKIIKFTFLFLLIFNLNISYSNYDSDYNCSFDIAYSSYNDGDFSKAVKCYEYYLRGIDKENVNYKIARNNLLLSYKQIAGVFFDDKDYASSIYNYEKALNIKPDDFVSIYGIGAANFNNGNYKTALEYYEKSYDLAQDTEDLNDIINMIDKTKYMIKYGDLFTSPLTNDTYYGNQYYLKQLNIVNAWSKVINNNEVIVSVIDDGIDQNHPDLFNNIWVNPNSKYGDLKTIDFIDDGLNGTKGEHGTMVAGIIGATQNNNEGIAGIGKNVKIMPLRVFGTGGTAETEDIINAINYSIDNGANIINLSLGGNQNYYTDKYDKTIKRAFDNGVIIVIAAGNGDNHRLQEIGINLDNNPIAPVCNNEGKYKYSIGVYATDKDGYRTSWTNYGKCSQFFAPGEGIISTSIPIYNSNYGDDYNISDGTSFSAPIVTGIIALGYNQYGYFDPITIYDSLEESKVLYQLPDGSNGYMIDASKYISILGDKFNNRTPTQICQSNYGFNSYSNGIKQKNGSYSCLCSLGYKFDSNKKCIKNEENIIVNENNLILNNNNSILNNNETKNLYFINANILAEMGIINKKNNESDYNLYQNVLRQEIAAVARGVAGIEKEIIYSPFFSDVTNESPNTWAYSSINALVNYGIIAKNKNFNPEANISKSEALGMIIKAACGNKYSYNNLKPGSWQDQVVNYGYENGISENFNDYDNSATRGFVFNIAVNAINKCK